MFDFIRTHQRLMQLVLLVLILPSFVLIGVSGYTNYVSGDEDLVKVGDTAITLQEFDQARRNQLQQLQQSSQGSFDPAVLDNVQARQALLDSLVDRRVLITTATKEHFSVSDASLRQAIASMPQLQVNGQFSSERYNEVLASVGLKMKDFEQGQRAELALERVLGPVADTATAPSSVVSRIEQALTAQRTVRLAVFPTADFEKDITLTEDDIKAWYEQNKQGLELPEQVTAQYLLLNEAAALASVPAIGEDQLQAYYEQNKARYVQPARVNLSHILIHIPAGAPTAEREKALARANELAAQAKADPSTFAALARDASQDAGTAKDGGRLGWITQGSWPAELEKAVFSLEKGAVSDPIEGAGGYHVFFVNDIQPEHGESFEQAKAKVQAEVRRQLAAERFADMATQLTSLVYDNPTSLQPAADALGIKLRTASGIARDRLLAADETGPNAASASEDAALLDDVRVRRALFSPQALTEKHNSSVIEISPDTMLVVRVEAVTPAQVPPLEKVEPQIRQVLMSLRAREAAQKAGEKALAEFQQADKSQVPEQFGTALTVSRISPQGLDKPILDAAFAGEPENFPHYVGVKGPQGYVVVRVEDAKPGTDAQSTLASLPLEISQALGRAEEQAVLKELRLASKVTVLPEAEKALSGQSETQE
jgi:peptidyl-prolyl cis-trans isomerase D